MRENIIMQMLPYFKVMELRTEQNKKKLNLIEEDLN